MRTVNVCAAGSVDLRASNGILIIDKPGGVSSGYACRRVSKSCGLKKAGHLGTLDPQATGVLPLCINEATRLAQFLMQADKEYVATMRLGSVTDTQDSQGRELSRTDRLPESAESIRDVCARFQGAQQQVPPMYSALKRNGRPLYELARRGETIKREARPIHVHALEVMAVELPDVVIRVHCSHGTYVRTLCNDIGQVLGCGAHLAALRRTRCGHFGIGNALPMETALACDPAMVPERHFVSIRRALRDMPELIVPGKLEGAVLNGVRLQGSELPGFDPDALPVGARVRLVAQDGRLMSVSECIRTENNAAMLRPVRVFAQ